MQQPVPVDSGTGSLSFPITMGDRAPAPNRVIKKKTIGKEKERELIDDLLVQLESEQAAKTEETAPIEITEQVKEKMMSLMDTYFANRAKMTKVNAITRNLRTAMNTNMNDLKTLMKLYGLRQLIKGEHQFLLEQDPKKKPLRLDEYKEVVSYVLDSQQVEKINEVADQATEEVVVEKLKCLKYKQSKAKLRP